MHFKKFKGLLDQISEVVSFSLTVINLVTEVSIFGFEQIHNWKDLSVVWHKSLSNGVGAGHEGLQDFQGDGDNLWVPGVQSSLNWDNELGDDWQDLGSSLLEHIKNTLDCEESVWVHFLPNALEKDWEVMVIIQLLNLYLPVDFVFVVLIT